MMKKAVFTTNIIRAVFVFGLLTFVFTKNEQLGIRVMIAVFLLLTGCYMLQNLCELINKPLWAKSFHKLFVIIFFLFGFGFLIVWSYAWIKENQYLPLIFTIPFWALGIYLVRRALLGTKVKDKKTKKKSKLDFRIVVSCFLVLSVLLSGALCLIIGIKDTYHTSKRTKNYLVTTGYFKNYEIYASHEERQNNRAKTHTTYRLTYVYKIDGKEYMVKTDYGSGNIPSINSTRKVKYNPNNPSEAVLMGTNRNRSLIYFGAFFLLGGMVFVLVFLYGNGVFDKIKINIISLYVGIVFLVVGIGIIALQMGETATLTETIRTMGFWILIPIMFIIVGGLQIIKSLFFERLKINSNIKKGK